MPQSEIGRAWKIPALARQLANDCGAMLIGMEGVGDIAASSLRAFLQTLKGQVDQRLPTGDLSGDYVVSGLLPPVPAPAALSTTIPAGAAWVSNKRVAKDVEPLRAYTASTDTYVDLASTGSYVYGQVANGGAAPTLAVGNHRLFRVVTNATQITAIDDLRTTKPPLKPHNHATGDLPIANDGVSSPAHVPRADDSRLFNQRTPPDASVTHAKGAADVGFLVISETAPVSPVSRPGVQWHKPSDARTYANIGTLASPVWAQIDAPMIFALSKSSAPSPAGAIPFRWRLTRNIRITAFSVSLNTPITGGTLTVDLDRATAAAPATMTSLYTTAANRPSISSTTAYGATAAGLPDTVDIPAGDFLQARIAVAPTGGADLAVFLEYIVRS